MGGGDPKLSPLVDLGLLQLEDDTPEDPYPYVLHVFELLNDS
jgi:hypothetical protein